MSQVTDRIVRNIKFLRIRSALSQAVVAARAGISKRYISKLESGEQKNVSVETVERIAEALEEKPEKLLCGDATEAKKSDAPSK